MSCDLKSLFVPGGRLYVVNGPYSTVPVPVRGYVIDMTSGRLTGTFAPDGGLHNPHDVVVSPDGSTAYVVELDPYKVHKFVDDSLKVVETKPNVTVPVKPTATVG
jgi:DNA-binding beta-propeller fold protein YncE